MKLWISKLAPAAWYAAVLLLIACAAGLSATEIANRLTDVLEFDEKNMVDGEAPPENDDADHAQITAMDPPATLTFGQSFKIEIDTDFEQAEKITGAMIRVEHSDKYIEIEQKAVSNEADALRAREGSGLTLTGELGEDTDIDGRDFTIYIALITEDGETGMREEWNLSIPELDDRKIDEYPDGDFNANFYPSCSGPDFFCSDGEMSSFMQDYQALGLCSNGCWEDWSDEVIDGDSVIDGDVDASEYDQCISCCLADIIATGHDPFVECLGCLQSQNDDQDPAEIRTETEETWTDFSEEAANCAAR